jgi:hypothetical protein
MKTTDFLPYRVPVLDTADYSFRFWMKGSSAFDAMRAGRAEEVYSDTHEFIGIIMLEKPVSLSPQFHRPSLDSSDPAISDRTCFYNAGYYFPDGPEEAPCIASHDLVTEYPAIHDDRAVTICAGKIHGATIVSSLPA